jgi:hypothetical protein
LNRPPEPKASPLPTNCRCIQSSVISLGIQSDFVEKAF